MERTAPDAPRPDPVLPAESIVDDEAFVERARALVDRSRPALPPELERLYQQVRGAADLRHSGYPQTPPVLWQRFEVYDAKLGGMGLVLQALDPELERMVAIKLWLSASPAAQQALLNEAKMVAQLSHPGVIAVYETGRWGEQVYFVMEWIDGMDGHVWMERPLFWEEIRVVFVLACDGLEAAHDAGIQHRDFKPSNMLIGCDGRVVIVDFGVALHEDDVHQEGDVVGTRVYMAPERLRGGQGDARSDQFSLCVALWRALFGVRPFEGESIDELLASIEAGELRKNPEVEVPPWLEAVARKGLAVDPDARYPNMDALAQALLEQPEDAVWLPTSARPAEPVQQAEETESDVRFGERVLSELSQTRRGIVAAGKMVAAAMVLVGVGLVAVLGVTVTGRERSAIQVEVPQAAEAASGSEPACALSDSDVPHAELDPVVVTVCRLIRLDEFEAASLLWDREQAGQQSTGADALIVVRTFIDRAQELSTTSPRSSLEGLILAKRWLSVASTMPGIDPNALLEATQRADQVQSWLDGAH